jgi:hypothetical protein
VLAILAGKPWPPNKAAEPPSDLPLAAATPSEPEVRPERPKRLPPTISPEPA